MPVVSAYAEVDSGDMLCRIVLAEDEGQSAVVLAINGGNFAQNAGIGTDTSIKIEMDEKGGYLDEYILRHLGGTTNRADYADLTDEQYANFRPVAAPGIAAGVLYRSSSPVNPVLNRNREADAALDAAGVRSVLNLADTEDAMKAYPGFAETHYAERTILPLAMTMDYMSGEFRDKLAAALRFIAGSDGPWLVHCSHGKDRTGFLCAVL
jgi:protein tyrosine/serine phosphatase